jgi:hypothetical protein
LQGGEYMRLETVITRKQIQEFIEQKQRSPIEITDVQFDEAEENIIVEFERKEAES